MSNVLIPGFTAEASISNWSIIPSIVGSANQMGSAVIVPQLLRQVPCWYNNRWQTCEIYYDDPGGWGTAPWIGDVSERQCMARCRRFRDPILRAECLDEC